MRPIGFVGDVGHCALLPECTEAGRRFESDLCVDAPRVERHALHERVAADAAAFFERG